MLHLTKLNYKHSAVVYLLSMATSLVISVVLTLTQGSKPLDDVLFWVINGAYSICLGGVALLSLAIDKQPLVQGLGLNKKISIKQVVLLLSTVFVLINLSVVVNNWLIDLLNSWGATLSDGSESMQIVLRNPVVAILVACLLPAINEELVFRGVFVRGLHYKFGTVVSVVFSAFAFAVFHGSVSQTLHQFLLGCLLSWVALSTDSVVLPMMAHFFNNVAVVLLGIFVEPTGVYDKWGWLVVVICLALLVPLVALCCKQFKVKLPTGKQALGNGWLIAIFGTFALSMFLWIGSL